MSSKPYRILSLDGGGIRGIIPATFLAALEERTGKPIYQLFDIISGTSTGGILASGLAMRSKLDPTKPQFSAKDLLGLYTQNGKQIFEKRPRWLGGGILNSAYRHDGLEKLLLQYFGDAELKDTLVPILITSYEIEKRKPFYFNSRLAQNYPDQENYKLRDVCRATSAAPTYFEPHRVVNKAGESFSLVDGGMCANNPSLLGYTESVELRRADRLAAVNNAQDADVLLADSRGIGSVVTKEFNPNLAPDSVLVSLGTGTGMQPYLFDKAIGWGALSWVTPVIDILMQGTSEAQHDQIQYVLPDSPLGRHYYRFNKKLDPSFTDMADASDKNIQGLMKYGRELVEEHSYDIDRLAEVLSGR
jgi:uncharacterized protein